MPRFPVYGLPFHYYRPYAIPPLETKHTPNPPPPPPQPKPPTPVWFDLFGIKLYFDDVLILSLLFLLYKEEVKDEGLFLALLMLLIS